jgi:hypothetical protein
MEKRITYLLEYIILLQRHVILAIDALLLLHCCSTFVALLLHFCCTVVTLLHLGRQTAEYWSMRGPCNNSLTTRM